MVIEEEPECSLLIREMDSLQNPFQPNFNVSCQERDFQYTIDFTTKTVIAKRTPFESLANNKINTLQINFSKTNFQVAI